MNMQTAIDGIKGYLRRHGWFVGSAALFAALIGWVFWGTWGTMACPVMPDAPMSFPENGNWRDFLHGWLANGKATPWDWLRQIGSPYLWQELQYAVGVGLSAVGLAYWLRGRGLCAPARWGAGLLLAFSGYWLSLFSAGHAGWFMWMMFGMFGFGLADRAVRKGKLRHWTMLGACVAWGSFWQPDLWFIFSFFNGVYLVWCCVRERKLPAWRGLLAAALVFAAVGAPGLVGAVGDKAMRDRQVEESKGTALAGGARDDREARWVFVTNWSLPPEESLEFIVPRLNGDTSCRMVLGLGAAQGTGVRPYIGTLGCPLGMAVGNYRQHSLYMGWVTCLFALVATVALIARRGRWRGGEVVFLAVAAVLFWALSLGRNFEPLYRLVFALPVGDSLRAPVKWHHLTELCACALAGYGIDALFGAARRRFGRGAAAATAALAALVAFGAWDLARVDRLYCAAVDLSLVRRANAAADEIIARGGGKLLDLAEGGAGMMARSFSARRIEVTGDPADAGIRFVWLRAEQLMQKYVWMWTRDKRATQVGAYRAGAKSIAKAGAGAGDANAALLEIPGAPKGLPPEPQTPPFTAVTFLGWLSLAAGAAASIHAALDASRRRA